MTATEALDILTRYNAWRRGDAEDYPDSTMIGKAIDFAIATLNKGQEMKRREILAGACVAAAALPVAAQDKGFECGPGPQTLNAAGSLLLLATAEHGADGLRMAMLALVQQAGAGC